MILTDKPSNEEIIYFTEERGLKVFEVEISDGKDSRMVYFAHVTSMFLSPNIRRIMPGWHVVWYEEVNPE